MDVRGQRGYVSNERAALAGALPPTALDLHSAAFVVSACGSEPTGSCKLTPLQMRRIELMSVLPHGVDQI